MASNDVEVLDPETPVENLQNTSTGSEFNRRNFITALGVAGAAAGAVLLSSKSADAQQPLPNGFSQVDVINLLLNIKYLKATLYSYITQGADLPGSSYVTVGAGEVYNQPAKIAFSSQQITDLFNEMYYDELNQLIQLRALPVFGGSGTTPGLAVAPRPTMNLLGTGPSGTAPSSTTTTLTQAQAIALSRMLEDLSATAFANATAYLTGSNLQFAMQALATDGFHAGAVRLLSIQQGVQYQSPQFASVSTSNTAQSALTVSGSLTTGSNLIYSILGTNVPSVGQVLTGIGIPPGAGAVITALTNTASKTFTAITTKSSNVLTDVSSVSGLIVGQPITGTNVPANSYISAIGTNTVTISANGAASNASGSTTVSPTAYTTSGSATLTGVSSISGVIVGQSITGTGIPSGATVTAASGTTITISAAATATSQTSFTGIVTTGSPTITSVSSNSGLAVGTVLTGAGIPTGTTVTTFSTNTVTMSTNATATSATAETITFPSTITLTTPTTQTYTVGQSVITIAGNATVTGIETLSVDIADPQDVEPGDPGSAATSASGPSAIAGTSPAIYQGFFNTAGAGTSTSLNTPAGFAFARTFQQVLAILYGYNSTNSVISTQNYEGGFFPYGVGGNIDSVT